MSLWPSTCLFALDSLYSCYLSEVQTQYFIVACNWKPDKCCFASSSAVKGIYIYIYSASVYSKAHPLRPREM